MKHKSRLYLIRHGMTAGNRVRYVGWEDEPLAPEGVAQAKAAAAHLKGIPITAIYASPLSRAKETGRPLARERGLDVVVLEGLKEINYGAYQGHPKDVHPLKIRKAHLHEPMPGGESLSDVHDRLDDVIARIGAHTQAGETCAVVAHFWTNRILLGRLLALGLDGMIEKLSYKPGNGSILDVELAWDNDRLHVISTTLLTDEDSEDGA